jgi:Domain of unknown function (DUF1707)
MSIPHPRVVLKAGCAEVDIGLVAADPLDPFAADSLQHEQERTVRGLRESYAAGACTLDELTQRIAAVYAARTADEVRDAAGRLAAPQVVPTESALEPHLVRDEHVLWSGRPDPGKRITRSDVFTVPFSLMWGGFAIFWEATVIVSGAPIFCVLWGIPFVSIGLYMIAGRFFVKSSLRRRTLYAVTDRRVLRLVRRRSGDSVDAVFLDAIPAVNRDVRPDGSGSVFFGSNSLQARANSVMPAFAVAKSDRGPLAFEDIPDAARVADLVTDLRRSPVDD